MGGTSDNATSAKAYVQAAGRGALFAGCMMTTLGILWLSTSAGPILDFRGIGRTALQTARTIASAPAQAATPFITNANFGSPLIGEAR